MKNSIFNLRITIFGLGLLSCISRPVFAASTDTLTISITPNAFYAVDIDTTNIANQMNLGVINLGASTQTVRPSTVTIQSTFATTDLKLQGGIGSSGTPWTFDDDTASSDTDKLAAWATFTSVARSSAPTQTGDYFSGTVAGASGSDVIDAANRYVGDSGTQLTTNLFETNSGFDSKNMDALPPIPDPNGRAHLWLYFRLPSATTSINAQNITITLTAVAPD